jgi:hypothetical protein
MALLVRSRLVQLRSVVSFLKLYPCDIDFARTSLQALSCSGHVPSPTLNRVSRVPLHQSFDHPFIVDNVETSCTFGDLAQRYSSNMTRECQPMVVVPGQASSDACSVERRVNGYANTEARPMLNYDPLALACA